MGSVGFPPGAIFPLMGVHSKPTLLVTPENAHAFLSMSLNKPPHYGESSVHEDGESFIDYTAKELAIKMTFEWDEKEATALFQRLQEPLASRVFHYLTKLRGIT